jgi:hypothetical protein
MPGFLFHVGAGVQCTHGGVVTTTPTQPRVVVNGLSVATTANLLTVAGCVFTVPGPKPQPCVRVQWANVSTRVLVNGVPPLLQTGTGPGGGICQSAEQIPQGPPIVSAVQSRVTAT